ncbi:FkbM family methyltransferase [Asticcacaulis sp. SL142]|uniref:FkbM family methyltransferase n=1 Tax=Asticcacaulis sp. SL142 TaxID=2995155 RepID=UPI00226CB0ED|nr:FkbM family methyltransferase [Asticcacaulis sp. SL142]WAC49581.1 FkbM family methyltransferase [Asticcacaulis sp. SL142]
MDIHDFENIVRTSGLVTFPVAGSGLTLDLSLHHERLYACKLLLNVRYPQADIDTMLIKRFVLPNDSVLDAGANIGFTCLEFVAAGARKITAVEPASALFHRLSTLSHERIVPISCAISSQRGMQSLTLSTIHNQGSSLKEEIRALFPQVFGADPEVETVRVTTIDDLCDEHGPFDIWKLDIEGAEVDALLGAKKTLQENAPRVIVAELYGPFYQAFANEVKDTHPFAYRALIRHADYALALINPDDALDDTYYQHSPMYVFCRKATST